MEQELTEEQIAEFKQAFKLCKSYDDEYNTIRFKDLEQLLISLGLNITRQELENLELDTSSIQTVDYCEFLALMDQKIKAKPREEKLLEAFQEADRDGDGIVSEENCKLILKAFEKRLTDKEIDIIIQFSIDNNGYIDYEKEYRQLYFQMRYYNESFIS